MTAAAEGQPVAVPHKNWHEKHLDTLDWKDRLADSVAHVMGSWTFIVLLTLFIGAWIAGNIVGVVFHWDPYPFILLNLAFSMQATYSTPIILMAQNRAADRDKVQAQHQFEHAEEAMRENTDLTRQVHTMQSTLNSMVEVMHAGFLAQQPDPAAAAAALEAAHNALATGNPDGIDVLRQAAGAEDLR